MLTTESSYLKMFLLSGYVTFGSMFSLQNVGLK